MEEIKVIYGPGTDVVGEVYYTTTQEGIQKAVTYAGNNGGGTVFITKGTYNINSSINLKSSNISIKGECSGTVLLSGTFQDSIINVLGSSSSLLTNIKISDICLDGSGEVITNKYGIYASRVGDLKITGITIDNCYIKKCYTNGIHLTSTTNSLISNNYIFNCGRGMDLDSSPNNIIRNNILSNITGMGIYVAYVSGHNNIYSNIIQNNSNYGIYVYSGGSNNISSNIIQNNNSAGIRVYSSNTYNNIYNNITQNNNGRGMEIEANENNISSNIVQNNNSEGIYISNNLNTIVLNFNEVMHNNKTGIYAYNHSGGVITGNASSNNYYYGFSITSSSSNIVTGSISADNSSNAYNISGATAYNM